MATRARDRTRTVRAHGPGGNGTPRSPPARRDPAAPARAGTTWGRSGSGCAPSPSVDWRAGRAAARPCGRPRPPRRSSRTPPPGSPPHRGGGSRPPAGGRAPASSTLPHEPPPLAQVAVAGVGADDDDYGGGGPWKAVEGGDDPLGRYDGRTRRPAHEQARLLRQASHRVLGLLRGNELRPIRYPGIVDARYQRRLQVFQALQPMKRPIGLNRDQLDGRVLLLQTPTGSHEGPGSAQPGHQVSHAAVGLAPDLLGGREVVGPRVGRMVVLIRVPVALRVRRGELAGPPDRPVRAVERIGEDHVGAV